MSELQRNNNDKNSFGCIQVNISVARFGFLYSQMHIMFLFLNILDIFRISGIDDSSLKSTDV